MSYMRWSSFINDSEKSVWYAYHDMSSGDRLDDQILAIHLAGGESAFLSYDDLCFRLERDFFDDLFPDHTQHEVLRYIVAQFLRDMQAGYPHG